MKRQDLCNFYSQISIVFRDYEQNQSKNQGRTRVKARDTSIFYDFFNINNRLLWIETRVNQCRFNILRARVRACARPPARVGGFPRIYFVGFYPGLPWFLFNNLPK